MHAILAGDLRPTAYIFLGLPYNVKKDELPLDEWLRAQTVPTLFVQETSDPYIGFDDLAATVSRLEVPQATLREIPGAEHHYPDIGKLGSVVREYLHV